MKRINGYIDLKEYFLEEYSYEEIRNISKKVVSTAIRFWIEGFDNTNVFFKVCNGLEFNELLVEEICKELNIECAHYDLAVIDGVQGVISYDYKKENAVYVNGCNILQDYLQYKKNTSLDDFSINDDTITLNNLDTIWNALDYRYRDYNNKEKIVADLMNELVKRFIFDLLLDQCDRHAHNWEIEELNDSIKLTPLYDNTDIFNSLEEQIYNNNQLSEISYSAMQTSYYQESREQSDTLDEFINTSSKEYIEGFIYLFKLLDIELFKKCIDKVIKRTNVYLSDKDKNKLINKFNINHDNIESKINNNKLGR